MFSSVRVVVVSVSVVSLVVTSVLISICRCVSAVWTWWLTALLSVLTWDEIASVVELMVTNGYFNGESIRLDGAIRMAPR